MMSWGGDWAVSVSHSLKASVCSSKKFQKKNVAIFWLTLPSRGWAVPLIINPMLCAVAMTYEADYIYFFWTLGKKIKWVLRANPRVHVQVDSI